MIYIYRPADSDGARSLADAVHGRRWKHARPNLRRGDVVVAWGARLAPIDGVRILNGAPTSTKYEQALKLKEENVPTITVSMQAGFSAAPSASGMAAFTNVRTAANLISAREFGDTPLNRDLLVALRADIDRALATPQPPRREWLPRTNGHIGGADLLVPTTAPDYFSLKETIVKEFRIHSFRGKSIRAGEKKPRAGATVHPWIRSYDGGWSIDYTGFKSKQRHRELAAKAVAALGLDFGAVDIGERADKSLIVLEVNRAPGLEGGTIDHYREAILGWERETYERRAA